jgi:hypothetical protein
MTIQEAVKFLSAELADDFVMNQPWYDTEREAWRTLIEAGVCPTCASETGKIVKLGKWQAGNYYEHAGRECPECEEFFVCGEQPEYEPDGWSGDAAPGLFRGGEVGVQAERIDEVKLTKQQTNNGKGGAK